MKTALSWVNDWQHMATLPVADDLAKVGVEGSSPFARSSFFPASKDPASTGS